MKTKELTISIPEGYEIDKEKSTFEKIVFKPIDSKVRSWEEYAETISHVSKWVLLSNGETIQYRVDVPIETVGNTVIYDSQEDAEAVHALAKLRLLRNQWVGDWKPEEGVECYKVMNAYWSGIAPFPVSHSCSWLTFPSSEMATDFIKTFHPLLEQAKPLL